MDQPKPSSSKSAPLPRASTKSDFDPDKATASLGQEHVQRLSNNLFRKLTEYTKGELIASSENYKLLETMNNITKEKYAEMSEMAQRLVKDMSKLQSTYADFSEYMKQIDDISEQADHMEKLCLELDDYTKYLEQKLRNANRTKT